LRSFSLPKQLEQRYFGARSLTSPQFGQSPLAILSFLFGGICFTPVCQLVLPFYYIPAGGGNKGDSPRTRQVCNSSLPRTAQPLSTRTGPFPAPAAGEKNRKGRHTNTKFGRFLYLMSLNPMEWFP